MDESNKCVSCGKDISNDAGSVVFKCPNCADSTMVRCSNCRKLASKYKCAKCGFEGPN